MNLSIAIEYAKLGWAVLPVHAVVDGHCTCGRSGCHSPGKHPATRRGALDASKDVSVITKMFGGNEHYNIGIATGEISGITVADIDVSADKAGAETWQALLNYSGIQTLETPMVETGSGGLHVYFAYNAVFRNGTDVFGLHVDCRNDGGYVLAPPSTHPSGNQYSWIVEPSTHLPMHMPAALARAAASGVLEKGKSVARVHRPSLASVEAMLECVSADDRDMWRKVGIILGREFDRSEEAWSVYVRWADQYTGKRASNHDAIMREAFYELSVREHPGNPLSIGTIIRAAMRAGYCHSGDVASDDGSAKDYTVDQFVFVAPEGKFLFEPTLEFWSADAVNATTAPMEEAGEMLKPASWLKRNRRCSARIFDPSFAPGVTIVHPNNSEYFNSEIPLTVYNMFRPGISCDKGDASAAEPWVQHVHRVFPEQGDADQVINFLAHRVQMPGEKIRFALVLAGEQGVGKDTVIEMSKPAIGIHNTRNISPIDMISGFNDYLRCLLLTIDEASDAQNLGKLMFAERVKTLIAGAPDHVTVNPKYERKYSARNVTGVVITTNHLDSGGLFVAQDDRRYDIIRAASAEQMGIGTLEHKRLYFDGLWQWFAAGGKYHIATYLANRDISNFDPARNRITRAAEDAKAIGMEMDSWLVDVITKLGNPQVISTREIYEAVRDEGALKLAGLNRRMRPALLRRGYVWVPNRDSKDGMWTLAGAAHSIYCLKDTPGDTVMDHIKRLSEGENDDAPF